MIFQLKDVIDEDYVNYKKPSMFIATNTCTFKCEKEDCNVKCQNSEIVKQETIKIDIDTLIDRYLNNSLTEAIVFGGLEPFDQLLELITFILMFRYKYFCKDDIVIYTGYTEEEIKKLQYLNKDLFIYLKESALIGFNNLIIKYGRFKANDNSHYDDILGINLASSNQYAKIY